MKSQEIHPLIAAARMESVDMTLGPLHPVREIVRESDGGPEGLEAGKK